jgi:hypothetical protein
MGQLYDRNCRRAFAPAEVFHADSLPAERFQSEMQVCGVENVLLVCACPAPSRSTNLEWQHCRRQQQRAGSSVRQGQGVPGGCCPMRPSWSLSRSEQSCSRQLLRK